MTNDAGVIILFFMKMIALQRPTHSDQMIAHDAERDPTMIPRWVYLSAGWLLVGLGIVGVVLPVLPTTPFMLLALFCFARSSERFHQWLYHHPRFGPPLQQWEEHRVIPKRAKIASLSAMSLSLSYMVFWAGLPWTATLPAALLMGYGAWFILSHPSTPQSALPPASPKADAPNKPSE